MRTDDGLGSGATGVLGGDVEGVLVVVVEDEAGAFGGAAEATGAAWVGILVGDLSFSPKEPPGSRGGDLVFFSLSGVRRTGGATETSFFAAAVAARVLVEGALVDASCSGEGSYSGRW